MARIPGRASKDVAAGVDADRVSRDEVVESLSAVDNIRKPVEVLRRKQGHQRNRPIIDRAVGNIDDSYRANNEVQRDI